MKPDVAGTIVVKVLSAMKKNHTHNYKPSVKLYEILGIIGIIVIMILISVQLRDQRPPKSTGNVDMNRLDPRSARISKLMGAQVVPGESVGKLRLGDFEETVVSLIGAPQLGDAAMCKSWTRWEWGNPQHVVELFSSCDAKKDMKKTVRQIRFSGLPFETATGITPQSTFAQIEQHYKDLEVAAMFKDKATGQQRMILDQPRLGIAFEVDAIDTRPNPNGKCHMIIIYPPGQKVIDTELPPQWDLHPLK